MPKRKSRSARKNPGPRGNSPRGTGKTRRARLSPLDRKLAENSEKVEQGNKSKALLETGPEEKEVEKAQAEAEQPELLQRLRRDYNVQHLRDQIAAQVVQEDWRKKVLGWKEETPSQLGRLRNAVLRPVIKDQDWQKQFKTFIETLDPEKWAAASTDNLNRLAEPDRFWQAADIEPPEVEPHFYWRAALTTLLLGALRAHSRERKWERERERKWERERERVGPGADG